MRRGAFHFAWQALRREYRRGGWRRLFAVLAYLASRRRRRDRRRKRDDGRAFDAGGYDTAGIVIPADLPADGHPYEATPTYMFEAAMALLDVPVDGASFVDLGSGKGRILLLAARRPFARLIGVEPVAALQAIARANLARDGGDPRIRLELRDAAAFAFPAGPLVLFLFNPFGPRTMARVAATLHADWAAAPRPIRLLYVNPQHQAEWLAAGFERIAISPDRGVAAFAPVPARPDRVAS